MALSILNNIPSLAAQNQMTITNSSLQKTLFRLSSGSRINSGADDAAGLAIADGLRANVTALTQSSRNATDGIGKLQVADGALSQVTSLLNRAVTLATEASTGTLDAAGNQRAALNAEFTSIKSEIDRIGQKTTFNGAAIFSSAGPGVDNNKLVGSAALTQGTAVTNGQTAVIKVGGTTSTFTAGGSETVASMLNQINTSGIGVVASLDGSGNLQLQDTLGRGSISYDASSTWVAPGAMAKSATTGGNVMNVFLSDSTSTGTSTIGVTLNTFDSTNVNGANLSTQDLTSATNAQAALTTINSAVAGVASLRGMIGAGINRLQAASDVMSNQVQNLSGAEDGIRSADIAQEVANMTKFNILSQTGISALSQANQMQQGVLALLR
jgi:flagellin